MPVKNEHDISEYNAVKASVESKGMIPMPEKRHQKYNAKPVCIDGFRFASGKEGQFYRNLKLAKKAGVITGFDMQVPFEITKRSKMVLDYVVAYPDERIAFIDVKGFRTQVYKLKKRQVEDIYGITIEEV